MQEQRRGAFRDIRRLPGSYREMERAATEKLERMQTGDPVRELQLVFEVNKT